MGLRKCWKFFQVCPTNHPHCQHHNHLNYNHHQHLIDQHHKKQQQLTVPPPRCGGGLILYRKHGGDNQLWKLENGVMQSKCGYVMDAGSGSAKTKVTQKLLSRF